MRAADGKVDAMPGRELGRDQIAGISTTDDNHRSRWKVTWQSVVGRVDLKDVGDEPRGQLGDGRRVPVATTTWSASIVLSSSPRRLS